MFFSFFRACFRLHWPRVRKLLPLFVAMALLLLLFCFGAAAAGSLLLGGKGFSPIVLAVADESEESPIAQIMARLTEMEDIRAYVRPVMAAPEDARSMVADETAAAAIVFPGGFLDSVYHGENLSPLLILDSARPLEVFGLSVLAENAGSMLANAQKGSYFIQSVYGYVQPAEPDFNRMLWEVDLKYASWVLSRGEMYRRELVTPIGGALSQPRHYLLSAMLFFCFLAPAGLLYPFFSWSRQRSWLLRLRGGGQPLSAYALSQIVWGAAAVFLLLALLLGGFSAAGAMASGSALNVYGGVYGGSGSSAGNSAGSSAGNSADSGTSSGASLLSPAAARLLADLKPGLSASALPGLLLIAVFLSVFTFLCCSTGHIFSALSLDFVLAAVFLVLSGGLVPAALLPGSVRALSPYSPLTWMRELMAALYLPGAGSWASAPFAKLASVTLLLIAAAMLGNSRFAAGRGAGR
ncbi:MAG: hypothetical protein FWG28_04885 [Clostridiales bacterium]|nr:hypothetical protein [Clostridiales bacterium]